jgi:phosphatidate cytidylyltransferase
MLALVNNPLDNPLFIPTVMRLLFVFLFTFPLVIIYNLKKLKAMFHSNMWQRYYAFFFMAPIYMAAVFCGGVVSLSVLFIVMCLALNEFRRMSGLPEIYFAFTCLLGLLTVIVTAFFPDYFYSLPVIYYLILTLIPVIINNPENSLTHVSYSLFACIWINFSLAHFILAGYRDSGLNMMILMGYSIVFSDVFAFVIGKLFAKIHFLDKYKIADRISPNKTFAGIIGHVMGAGIGIAISRYAIPMFDLARLAILALLIGVHGLLGGLTESMVKRTFNVKDASHLIPGHGGVLDRIDSAIRIIVIFYYYLIFFL